MTDRKEIYIEKITGSTRTRKKDLVVRETAVTIHLNNTELVTLVCSPTHLQELCYGFLYAEGIITAASDVTEFFINEKDGLAWVETRRPVQAEHNFLKRHVASCCGRGRASFYFVNDADIEPVSGGLTISTAAIVALRSDVERRAALFTTTGGAHGAALSDGENILCFFEDVGRHNTLDKISGWCLLQKMPARNKVLLFSGRVSSEILLKTARLGISVVISRSAPTDLALELADQLNITVVGFARGDRMNIYTRGERITGSTDGAEC
ncbi:formate dehydrogenase accessory sulfurtransferase FdhD [Desulfoscipio geothermicus]|uniref:Sulfur carrier protein FdhD n=1 Tax=Desulfoscipio geothermicus DSM 3669 TaxID=1121426 RepID=A0A1I6E9Y7_9FIRM|nr:formate dehydrogenase accessory sulfurtransferase FdhD [Desulfoscipio geothermicus]SFR14536.1 FdhD protein [Desulfoscipio geothermicus DSM 3669]